MHEFKIGDKVKLVDKTINSATRLAGPLIIESHQKAVRDVDGQILSFEGVLGAWFSRRFEPVDIYPPEMEPRKSHCPQNWTTRHLNPNPSSSKACTCDLVSVLMIQGCQCKAI